MDESTGSIVNLKVSDNRKEKCTTMMILGLEAFKVFMACMLSLFVSQKCDDHVCNVSDIFQDDTTGNHAVIGLNFFTLFAFMIGYYIEYMREQYIIHHFNNNPKLSDHNIIKIIDKDRDYEGTFYAGYPLQVGSKAVLEIDNKEKIVFFAHPSPKAKAEKDHAWAQKYDQKKLVDYLKKGSKAVMSAISHRNTVTKDTFMLTGFSDALSELEKRCK